VSDLFAAVCSITATRRRRFLWAVWWNAPPSRHPFRKPDAYRGGARTHEEALHEAQKTTGMRLAEIEPLWARAWSRILIGQPPWSRFDDPNAPSSRTGRSAGAAADSPPPPPPPKHPKTAPRVAASPSVWEILGTAPHPSAADLKRAFHKRALATHPDHGGDPEAFRDVQRAYKDALKRIARPRKPPQR
jgi:hypothetical protein